MIMNDHSFTFLIFLALFFLTSEFFYSFHLISPSAIYPEGNFLVMHIRLKSEYTIFDLTSHLSQEEEAQRRHFFSNCSAHLRSSLFGSSALIRNHRRQDHHRHNKQPNPQNKKDTSHHGPPRNRTEIHHPPIPSPGLPPEQRQTSIRQHQKPRHDPYKRRLFRQQGISGSV